MKFSQKLIAIFLLAQLGVVSAKGTNSQTHGTGCFHNSQKYAVVQLGHPELCPAYNAHIHDNISYKSTTPIEAAAAIEAPPSLGNNDNSEDPHCYDVTSAPTVL